MNVHVRGVSDSGWFLDREPFTPGVAAAEAVRQGWKLWDGVLPDDCVAEQKEPWRCYFGHRLYNTLKCKSFITLFFELKFNIIFMNFQHLSLSSNGYLMKHK